MDDITSFALCIALLHVVAALVGGLAIGGFWIALTDRIERMELIGISIINGALSLALFCILSLI